MTQTNQVKGSPPPLTIVQPGEREVTGDLGGIGVAFKLWGRDTNGMVSVVEHPFAVGALVEPHLHTREDEYSIVTEGEIGFRSGSREVVLGPGGYITKPRGEMHAMWNAGSVPARMIEIISPAGLESFFWELSELVRADVPPDITQLVALAETYGVQFGEPDWLPDIIDRYKLNAHPREVCRPSEDNRARKGARDDPDQPCHRRRPLGSVMSAGAASPEELEGMLEDACLVNDTSFLPNLFDVDAVLLARGTGQVRGRSAITNVIIDQLRHGGSYVAAPQLVMQSGPLALIISDAAISVARRNLDGWHYVISRLDL